MRKLRKGFTLVELLIVIAILGALSATMSVATSGSTAKAKATAIVASIDSCKSAAMLYLVSADAKPSGTIDDILTESIPAWDEFKTGAIRYKAEGEATDSSKWTVTVDFSDDPDAEGIKAALKKIKGYGGDKAKDGAIKVTLTSGKVEKGTAISATDNTENDRG